MPARRARAPRSPSWVLRLDGARRQGVVHRVLLEPCRGSGSSGAGGVGDVAGERGDRQSQLRACHARTGGLAGAGAALRSEAVMRELERMRSAWDTDSAEVISDFIDGGDRVAVRFILRAVGHGPSVAQEMTALFTVRKGKILALELFWDHAGSRLPWPGLVRALQPAPEVNLAALVRDDDLSAAKSKRCAVFRPSLRVRPDLFGTPKIYRGPEGLRAMLLDWLAPWEAYRSQIEETIDCGEQVVVLGHVFGRRQDSDREISAELADVWTVRAGSSCAGKHSPTATKPSKPWGWRSRRCPRSPRPPTWWSLCGTY